MLGVNCSVADVLDSSQDRRLSVSDFSKTRKSRRLRSPPPRVCAATEPHYPWRGFITPDLKLRWGFPAVKATVALMQGNLILFGYAPVPMSLSR